MGLDTEIFGKTKFSDVLKNIYTNQQKKDKQLTALIADLKPFITNHAEAVELVPILADIMEIGVRNDESLVKMAAVVQRLISNTGDETESFFSDAEKEDLLKELAAVAEEQGKIEIPNGSIKDNSKRE